MGILNSLMAMPNQQQEDEIDMSDPMVQRIIAMQKAPQLQSVSGGPTSGP